MKYRQVAIDYSMKIIENLVGNVISCGRGGGVHHPTGREAAGLLLATIHKWMQRVGMLMYNPVSSFVSRWRHIMSLCMHYFQTGEMRFGQGEQQLKTSAPPSPRGQGQGNLHMGQSSLMSI